MSRIRASIAIATYATAIQTDFREVADGLAARATFTAQLDAQKAAVAQAERRLALTRLSHRAGMASRLELLEAQRTLCAASKRCSLRATANSPARPRSIAPWAAVRDAT